MRICFGFTPALLVAAVTGCQTARGPDTLRIEPGGYEMAFDTAVEVAKDAGMPPEVRDRRSGVIETVAVDAPTLLEPWRIDGTASKRRLEQTVSHERRRARFEFMPVEDAAATEESATLVGPDLLGTRTLDTDRTSHAGPLDLRVWVYTERSHQPGLRRDTWTRRGTSYTTIIEPDGERLPRQFWTPVARDPDMERRLLAEVRRSLAPALAQPSLAPAPNPVNGSARGPQVP